MKASIGRDDNASERKSDHIDLAFKSHVSACENYGLVYEPLLAPLNPQDVDLSIDFAGQRLSAPLWISSMTGGAAKAKDINRNLALAAGKMKIAMGLGSCRSLLESDEHLDDFCVRHWLGDMPLFANLGIAQLEQLVFSKQVFKLNELTKKLQAHGIIIHVNPMQEFMQKEGDRYRVAPIETIKRFIDEYKHKVIVKEVGQGMGPRSLQALSELPLEALEYGAFGGTNFAQLERLRQDCLNPVQDSMMAEFTHIGHDAAQMTAWLEQILNKADVRVKCRSFIISGGVNSLIKAHALKMRLRRPALIGMASAYLKHAMISSENVQEFISFQMNSLKMAELFLLRSEHEHD